MSLSMRFQLFWDGLAARERGLIVFGLTVLLPVGLYLYVWQPVTEERTRLATRVQQLRIELTQLRTDAEEIKRLQSQMPVRGGNSLEVVARQSAALFGLPDLERGLSARGNDRLEVTLDNVAFDAWLRWLGELGLQGVSLATCKVQSLPTPGQVSVKATLTRTGS
jgi:general secretion pathway protein M